jgi:hypothetical protein
MPAIERIWPEVDRALAHLRREGSALGRSDPTARMAHDPAVGALCVTGCGWVDQVIASLYLA